MAGWLTSHNVFTIEAHRLMDCTYFLLALLTIFSRKRRT